MDGAGSSLITAISISYIPGGKSHGKPYERRGNQAEGGYGTYGASDGTGGARSATVAGSRKSGSTESESTAASGTITRYVAAADLDRPDIDVFTASNIFRFFHLSGSESHGKPSSRGRGDSTENGCRTHGASVDIGGASNATVAESHKSGSAEPESTAAGGTITRYVAAADLDRPDIDVFTASNIFYIFHISGSESHGKSSSRGRGDSTENRCCIHGASVGAGGARSATIAEGSKSGSAEPEFAVASGTIAGYVAAASGTITRYVTAEDLDRPDIDVFTASNIFHLSGSESHGKPSSRGRGDSTENGCRTYGASVGTGGARSATVAEGRKSGSAEPESAVASGTIARYVAATGLDNSDVAVFTA